MYPVYIYMYISAWISRLQYHTGSWWWITNHHDVWLWGWGKNEPKTKLVSSNVYFFSFFSCWRCRNMWKRLTVTCFLSKSFTFKSGPLGLVLSQFDTMKRVRQADDLWRETKHRPELDTERNASQRVEKRNSEKAVGEGWAEETSRHDIESRSNEGRPVKMSQHSSWLGGIFAKDACQR